MIHGSSRVGGLGSLRKVLAGLGAVGARRSLNRNIAMKNQNKMRARLKSRIGAGGMSRWMQQLDYRDLTAGTAIAGLLKR